MHACTLILNPYCEFIMINREALKKCELSEMTYLDDADRRAILLKRINGVIRGEQAYLRIKWKRKQFD